MRRWLWPGIAALVVVVAVAPLSRPTRRRRWELAYYQQNPKTTDSTSDVYAIWEVPAAAPIPTIRLHQAYVSGPPDAESPAAAPKQATATADVTLTVTP